MPRACHWRRTGRQWLALAARVAVGLGTWSLPPDQAWADSDPAAVATARQTVAAPATASAAVNPGVISSPSGADSHRQDDRARPSRSLFVHRFSSGARAGGADGWYLGLAGIALALAVCGGFVATARRLFPQGASPGVQIVSRVSLSPKHSVYLLRIGGRVLLVGAGPQGPPTLISELDDDPCESEPTSRQGGEA
jgi:hypothetical protein